MPINGQNPLSAQQQKAQVPSILGKTQKGTGYSNISKLLNSNATQGAAFGGKVAQGLSNIGTAAEQATKADQDEFNNRRTKAANDISKRTAAGSGIISNLNEGGSSDVSDEIKKAWEAAHRFTNLKGLTGIGQAANQEAADSSKSSLGTLLGNQVQSPKYTAGLRKFDTAIVSQTPQYQQIKQLQTGLGGLNEQYGQLNNATNTQTQGVNSQQAEVGKTLDTNLKTTLGADNDAATKLTTDRNKEINDTANTIIDQINAGNLDEKYVDVLQKAGLDLGAASSGISKEDIIGALGARKQLSTNEAISAQQANAINALSALSGATKIYDPSKAGYNGSIFNTDLSGYNGNENASRLGADSAKTLEDLQSKYDRVQTLLERGKLGASQAATIKRQMDELMVHSTQDNDSSPNSDIYTIPDANREKYDSLSKMLASVSDANKGTQLALEGEGVGRGDTPQGGDQFSQVMGNALGWGSPSNTPRTGVQKFNDAINQQYAAALAKYNSELSPSLNAQGGFNNIANLLGIKSDRPFTSSNNQPRSFAPTLGEIKTSPITSGRRIVAK